MTKHILDSPAEVRREVIAQATKLFAARGFQGASLQDIAEAAGVSKPTVLYHFATKELIRAAVYESMLDHWRDALPRLLLAATTGVDRFDAIHGELSRFFRERPDFARLVLREALDRPEATRGVLRDAVRPWLAAIAATIREGVALGWHPANVDSEFYVLLVMQVAIMTAAIGDVMSVTVVEGEAGEQRYHQEATRMMKSSLFTDAMLHPPRR